MIEEVTEKAIHLAAMIHSISWKESRRSFYSEDFISAHTPEKQKEYLHRIIHDGATLYMLTNKGEPVGIVSVNGSLIENLYVLPAGQHKGYGHSAIVKQYNKEGIFFALPQFIMKDPPSHEAGPCVNPP